LRHDWKELLMIVQVDWEQKADDLERGLINGIIPGTFLTENASNRDWYQIMLNLSERERDPGSLRAMVRGILKLENLLKKMDSKGAKIIGIGSAALKIFNLLKNLEISVRDILFLDNDDWTLEKSSFTNLKLPWANMLFMTRRKDGEYVPLSWGGIHHGGPSLGRLMSLGFTDQIARIFENVNSALMVATLGGAAGSGASPIVAAILKEMGVKVTAIIQSPFPFEYRKRSEAARESLEIIQQLADKTVVVEGQEVLKRLDKKITLLDAFKVLDREMANWVRNEHASSKE